VIGRILFIGTLITGCITDNPNQCRDVVTIITPNGQITKEDSEQLKLAEKKCKEYFGDNSCVKTLERIKDREYKTICK
jgi:hypothetical protein